MSIDLDKLEALARAATPGLWTSGWPGIAFDEAVRRIYDEDCHTSEDAAFIAAANPATVLELIAQARAARPGLEYMTCCNHPDCTTCKGFGGHYRITSAGQPAQHRADGEERAHKVCSWTGKEITAADLVEKLDTYSRCMPVAGRAQWAMREAAKLIASRAALTQRADSSLPAPADLRAVDWAKGIIYKDGITYAALKNDETAQAQQAAAPAAANAGGLTATHGPLHLTNRKTAEIAATDYNIVGYVLRREDGEAVCISAESAVRWLPQAHYWRLMHEQNGSLFADSSPAASAADDAKDAALLHLLVEKGFQLHFEGGNGENDAVWVDELMKWADGDRLGATRALIEEAAGQRAAMQASKQGDA